MVAEELRNLELADKPEITYALDCNAQLISSHYVTESRKFNIYMTFVITLVGLVGNGMAIFVFAQVRLKKLT